MMSLESCTKRPNSMHPRNSCQSSKRTRRKIHQGSRREAEIMALVQMIIRRCFRKSETRLDDRVRFINPANEYASVYRFGSMNPCRTFNFLPISESQRRGRPSKNFSISESKSNDWNVHSNDLWSISGFNSKAYF